MNHYDVIKRPVVTEKSTVEQSERNCYSFEVDRCATKRDVKEAVQSLFKVTVVAVRTLNQLGKLKRFGRHHGRTSDWKKAIVKLKEGDKITLFEGQ